jgi:hypothetical protein
MQGRLYTLRVGRLAVTGVAVLLAMPLLASGLQERRVEQALGSGFPLRGTVVSDDPTHPPLRGALVVLTGDNLVSPPTHTDAEGRFEFTAPRSAAYVVTVTKAGFAAKVHRATATSPPELQIALARGAAVAGRVVDQYGDAFLTRVQVARVADEQGRTVARTERFADVDDLGEFRVGGLPAGQYEVTVDPRRPSTVTPTTPRSDRRRGPVTVRLAAGEETSISLVEEVEPTDPRGVVIGGSGTDVIEQGGAIRGRVVGPDAQRVGGAFVQLFIGGAGARHTGTAADGAFEFSGLPDGAYRIEATKVGAALAMVDRGAIVVVRQRQVVEEVTLQLRKSPAVVGTVLDRYGEPLEDLAVALLTPSRTGARRVLERVAGTRLMRTDDRGRYRLFPALPGDHYVVVSEEAQVAGGTTTGPERSLRMYYPGTASLDDALRVPVVEGRDTTEVNLAYVPMDGGRVAGTAFDAAGQPLAFPVTLVERTRAGRPTVGPRQARVGSDGTFVFLNVPPGDYVVQAVVRPGPGRAAEQGLTFVSVTGAEAPPVTVRTSRGTRVRGRVELEGDASRVQFDLFGVGVFPSDPDYDVSGIDRIGAGVENDGTFEFYVHGPMRIVSTAAPEGWWLKSATVGIVDAAEVPYTFGERGDPADLTVVFSDAVGRVAGQVTDSRGDPAPDAPVLVFPTDESQWYVDSRRLVATRTRADGQFGAMALPPGDYWIVAAPRSEAARDWRDAEALRLLARVAQRINVRERQRDQRTLRVVERLPP